MAKRASAGWTNIVLRKLFLQTWLDIAQALETPDDLDFMGHRHLYGGADQIQAAELRWLCLNAI